MFYVNNDRDLSKTPIRDHALGSTVEQTLGVMRVFTNINDSWYTYKTRKTIRSEEELRALNSGVSPTRVAREMYNPVIRNAQPGVDTQIPNASYNTNTQVLTTYFDVAFRGTYIPMYAALPISYPTKTNQAYLETRTHTAYAENLAVVSTWLNNTLATLQARAQEEPTRKIIVNVIVRQEDASVNKVIDLIEIVQPEGYAEITNPLIVDRLKSDFPVQLEPMINLNKVRVFKHPDHAVVLIVRAATTCKNLISTVAIAPVLYPELQERVTDDVKSMWETLLRSPDSYASVSTYVNDFIKDKYCENLDDGTAIQKLINDLKEARKSSVSHRIALLEEDIESMVRRHRELLQERRAQTFELLNMDASTSELDMLLQSLARSSAVVNFMLSGNRNQPEIKLMVQTPVVNYEPDLARLLFKNKLTAPVGKVPYSYYKAHLGHHGSSNIPYVRCTDEIYNQFMTAIFVNQKGYLRFGAGIKVNLDSNTLNKYTDIAELVRPIPNFKQTSLLNPHIMEYNCFGNTGVAFNKVMSKQQYSQVLPIITTAVSNLNFGDAVVMNAFKTQVTGNIWKYQTPWIQDAATDELLTTQEFLLKYVIEPAPEAPAQESPSPNSTEPDNIF